jgi:hypothetical protein
VDGVGRGCGRGRKWRLSECKGVIVVVSCVVEGCCWRGGGGGNSNEWVFGRDDLTGSEGGGASHPTSLGGDIIILVPRSPSSEPSPPLHPTSQPCQMESLGARCTHRNEPTAILLFARQKNRINSCLKFEAELCQYKHFSPASLLSHCMHKHFRCSDRQGPHTICQSQSEGITNHLCSNQTSNVSSALTLQHAGCPRPSSNLPLQSSTPDLSPPLVRVLPSSMLFVSWIQRAVS